MPLHPFSGHVSRHFSRSLRPDDKYLSYHDVTLLKEDVATLRNDWLTDNIIAFWEEYLEQEFLPDFKNTKIRLLRPAMSQMLKFAPDPRDFMKDKDPVLGDFTNVTHIFIPINDCEDPNAVEGGSHWSLLLVSIVDGVAFHYDSMMHNNQQAAYQISQKLSILLSTRPEDYQKGGNATAYQESQHPSNNGARRTFPIRFIELQDTPQQDNSSDCGVYLCLFMKHLLLRRLLMVRTSEKVSMSLGERKIDAKEGRREMGRVIEERRREGERRRSTSKSPGPGHKNRSPPRISSPMEPDRRPSSSSSRR